MCWCVLVAAAAFFVFQLIFSSFYYFFSKLGFPPNLRCQLGSRFVVPKDSFFVLSYAENYRTTRTVSHTLVHVHDARIIQ